MYSGGYRQRGMRIDPRSSGYANGNPQPLQTRDRNTKHSIIGSFVSPRNCQIRTAIYSRPAEGYEIVGRRSHLLGIVDRPYR